MEKDLSSLRKEINKIDNKLLELISARMKIAKKVGKYKKRKKIRIHHPEREKEILITLKQEARNKDIDAKLVDSVFKHIMTHSRKIQSKETGK